MCYGVLHKRVIGARLGLEARDEYFLLRTQDSATPLATTGGTPATQWLLSTQ
ncbi:hypothetical protein FDUTEX481_01447 [Tolypothrix sp. PCC 7601]|nr:hypothetical protein FDUTEX481_01447 [Tolypothrix sp. PCC 7601]